jgi:hypothetical protein
MTHHVLVYLQNALFVSIAQNQFWDVTFPKIEIVQDCTNGRKVSNFAVVGDFRESLITDLQSEIILE